MKIGGQGDGSGHKAVVVCEIMGAGVQNPRIHWGGAVAAYNSSTWDAETGSLGRAG